MRWLTLASVVALGVSSAIADEYVVHEKRSEAPKKWVKRSRVTDSIHLPMRIGMTQQNLHRAEDLLYEVSDPDSPKYGLHYTPDEIVDLFAPAKESVDAITAWLNSSGIALERISVSENKQWIQFDALRDEVENLFKTKYYVWEHTASGKHDIACDHYHLPAHVQDHVDYVSPGLKLLSGSKASVTGGDLKTRALEKRKKSGPILGPVVTLPNKITKSFLLQNCATLMSPPCIAALYNITQGTKAHPNNRLGIFEEGDFFQATDLAEFFALFAENVSPLTQPKVDGIDGGFAPLVATGESNLDLQISYPIINPQNSIIFQTDDIFYARGILQSARGVFNTFLDAIDGSYCNHIPKIDPKYPDPNPLGYQGKIQCGKYKPTNVISISYGEQEDDVPGPYQRRQCLEYLKLGMQGSSVIFASGDSGVAARAADDGNSNGCLGKNGTVFNPDFPASCPYVSSLGATFLPSGANVHKDQEQAVTSFPSGGGFSNIYKRPKYQQKAVHTYLTKHTPPYKSYKVTRTNNPTEKQTHGGKYNSIGRGYPDFSAIGDNVIIILDGAPTTVGGTSAAAPVFGSILNRINEERLAKGKSTVGFVNPVLYRNKHVFHDITKGSNPGCGTGGFSCAPGWDPVTGLGTPNYPAMLKLFMSLR